MATTFYFPSTGVSSASPAYDTNWEVTTSASRRPTSTTKQNSAMSTVSHAGDTDKTDQDILLRQYTSDQLAAQTIAVQALKWQIRASETNAANNLFTTISIRSWNGSTFQSILAITRDDLELTTSLVNRQFTATSTSKVVAAGDRLVIEIGLGGDPAQSSSDYHNGSMRVGDTSGSDLPENNTNTDDVSPWLQFANTLTFLTNPTVTTQACTEVTSSSATGNGNITATGGVNCTRQGVCYKTGTTGDPTVTDTTAYTDGSYGTGAYTIPIPSLSSNTSYRVRAYATNTYGTAYGDTVQILTKVILAGASSKHVHLSSTGALTVRQTLNGVSSKHVHLSNSGNIIQNFSLVGDSNKHVHTSSTGTVSMCTRVQISWAEFQVPWYQVPVQTSGVIQTLADVTASITGSVKATGTLAQTLADVTASITGRDRKSVV